LFVTDPKWQLPHARAGAGGAALRLSAHEFARALTHVRQPVPPNGPHRRRLAMAPAKLRTAATPRVKAAVARVLVLACAAATARTGAAQGAQTLSYTSYTNSAGCPALDSCVTSGFDYIWDAYGDVVFVPIAGTPSSPCTSYLGTAASSSTATSGALTLEDDNSNSYSATYTASTLSVTLAAGCVVSFSRGAATGAQTYAYTSYTGGAACAPDACVMAGYNSAADASANVAFLSASTTTTLGCSGYLTTASAASSSSSSGSLTFTNFISSNTVIPIPAGDMSGTYTATSVTVSTAAGCTATFTLSSVPPPVPPPPVPPPVPPPPVTSSSSAAVPRAAAGAAAAAMTVGAAVVAALL
jgi:hypothetical protein